MILWEWSENSRNIQERKDDKIHLASWPTWVEWFELFLEKNEIEIQSWIIFDVDLISPAAENFVVVFIGDDSVESIAIWILLI